MLNDEKTVYIDREQPCLQNVAACFYIADEEGKAKNIIFAGKSILSMPVNDKNEMAFQILANEYDVHFIFDDKIPQIEFYPVPLVGVFASDSSNGYFCSTNPELDILEEDAPIYYIDDKLNYYYLSSNLINFLSIVVFCPKWKEKFGIDNNVTPLFQHKGREYLIDTLHLNAEFSVTKDIKKTEDNIIIFRSIDEAKKKIEFYDIQKEISK